VRRPAALVAAGLSLAALGAWPVAAAGAPAPFRGAVAVAVAAGSHAVARARPPAAGSTAGGTGDALVSPAYTDVAPAGHRRTADAMGAIADRVGAVIRARRHGRTTRQVFLKGPFRWQVSYYDARHKEITQVILSDATGRTLETWTGFQVAWTMARGYPGAFGRKSNALYVWLPFCLLFVLPFVDLRRPRRLLHLDLAMILAPSVSFAFFNHADIGMSVPLAVPPLIYLLVRMLWIARVRGRAQDRAGPRTGSRADPAADPPPLRLLIPPAYLAILAVFLLGFRIGLNVTNANVIDVGYAGVIGAQRLADGQRLYGSFPHENQHGDTYGPVNYEAYVPFQQLLGWSGRWDDLPAAHAAAAFFDLLAAGGLLLLGRRIRGPTVGIALAYAWLACPWTLLVLGSDANDTLVGALLVAALLVCASPPARGAMIALAGLTKFAPLALAPLLATYGGGSGARAPTRAGRRFPLRGRLLAFALAFGATAVIVSLPLLGTPLHALAGRTLGFQGGRGSPFSPWGLYGGLDAVQAAVQAGAVVLALVVCVVPRCRDVISLAALSAAVLIALQLGITHWFYLYMAWFLPALLLALLGRYGEPAPEAARAAAPAGRPGDGPAHAAGGGVGGWIRAAAPRLVLRLGWCCARSPAARPLRVAVPHAPLPHPWRRLEHRLDGVGAHGFRRRDQRAHEPRILLGGVEADRHLGGHRLQSLFAADAEHAAAGTGHADVGDVCSASGQHPRVGRRDVGVGADDGGDATVKVPAHADLLARRLGMHVDEHMVDAVA